MVGDMPPSVALATAAGSLPVVGDVFTGGTRRYYVGAHRPHWLGLTTAPLFVSHVTLRGRKTLPRRATLADGTPAPWALDSGQFSDVSRNGRDSVWVSGTPAQRTAAIRAYADDVRRYRDEVGGLVFAAALDVMCEPDMLELTGLTERECQQISLDNYLELVAYAPDLPWAAPLQGWRIGSHARMVDMYLEHGIDLRTLPHVTVGSICRRPNAVSAALIIDSLHALGLRNLHAFGLKADAFEMVADKVASADSMAWSAASRSRQEPCPDNPGRASGCRNCLHYALEWRDELVTRVGWNVAPARPVPTRAPARRPAVTRPPARPAASTSPTTEGSTCDRTGPGRPAHHRGPAQAGERRARRVPPGSRRRVGRADPLDGSGGRGAAPRRRRAPRGGRAAGPGDGGQQRAAVPAVCGARDPARRASPARSRGPGVSGVWLLVCRRCGGGVEPIPFASPAERGRWAAAHTRGTGLSSGAAPTPQ